MKVIKWISYIDAEKFPEAPIGGLGGWFNHGHRWRDYTYGLTDKQFEYIEALRKSIIKNEKRITGEDHQYAEMGVPLFSDGTVATFSFRAWGDIMAAIWSEEEDKDYCYMDFYM